MTNIDLDQLARVTGGTTKIPNDPFPGGTGPTFPRPPICDPGPCNPPETPPFGQKSTF